MDFMTEDMKRYNHLTSETEAVYHEAALKLGLSDSAMLVLYTICAVGGACLIRDICRLSGASKQTIHSALQKLQSDGLVRQEAYDGKQKQVSFTERGKAVAEATVVRLIAVENEIFASWTTGERELYLELTQRYLTSLKEKIKEF